MKGRGSPGPSVPRRLQSRPPASNKLGFWSSGQVPTWPEDLDKPASALANLKEMVVTLLGQGPGNQSHPRTRKVVSAPGVNAVGLRAALPDPG